MSDFLHKIYIIIGTVFCKVCLIWWNIRDKINPPKTDYVLFVAHPDDDALFFHTFIKEYKPYVCLMTTGWSLKRIPDFFKCMKYYGVRYRTYSLGARDSRMNLLEKQAKNVMNIKKFKVVATHNSTGEYGHEEHRRVHQSVVNVIKHDNYDCRLLCPVELDRIDNYPLDQENIDEKLNIFKNIYVTESWVPFDEASGTPRWVYNEKLEENIIYG